MNLERFGKLYDMLMTLPRSAPFDMHTYGSDVDLTNECATTACAMGWYARAFPEDGLQQMQSSIVDQCGNTGFSAAAKCLGISWDDANYLFHYDWGPETPKQVAARVKAFVESRE